MELHPRPFVDGILWPGLSSPNAASLLAMLFQLEQSQWLSAESLRQRQMKQAALVLRHARESVPFIASTMASWLAAYLTRRCGGPRILERSDIQDNWC
ncbi:MAG: hypothetical protein IPI44_11735 [Sulfuritalea sp.]|nr:hypothetical protein [Sulfuritalea sp.]